MVGMPAGMIFMLGTAELLLPIGMILGIYVQIVALILGIIMIGAITIKTMKWHFPFGAIDKTGWEFDLILLAANFVLFMNGGGAIDIQKVGLY